jgi:hypothetical protein
LPPRENQHKLISGNRDLTQTDIDLMNKIKAAAERVDAFVEKLDKLTLSQRAAEAAPFPAYDGPWVSIGRTHLKQGFMALTRAVAKPTTF